MRNIEKIKSMSVDEMAEWMYGFTDCNEYSCPLYEYCVGEEISGTKTCKYIIKQWLLAESENN